MRWRRRYVDIELAVLWQIKDAQGAFAVRNGERTCARRPRPRCAIIGKSTCNMPSRGWTKIEQDVMTCCSASSTTTGSASHRQVQLLRVDPPQEVIGAFRDVGGARRQGKEINEATPTAPGAARGGEAETIIQRADITRRRRWPAQGRRAALQPGLRNMPRLRTPPLAIYTRTIEEVLRREQGVGHQERRRPGVLPTCHCELRSAAGRDGLRQTQPRRGHAMSNRSIFLVIAIAIVGFLITQTFYSVDPTKQVLVRQFGTVGELRLIPGSAKIPLIQDISASTAGCSTTKPRSSRSSPATSAGGRRLCPLPHHQRPAVRRDGAGGDRSRAAA